MKTENVTRWKAAACGFAVLSAVSMGAAGLMLSGVRIEPKREAIVSTAAAAEELASGDMRPENLYTMAVRQTFVIRYTLPEEDGSENEARGTGFAISYDGYILTNCHVVSDGKQAGVPIIVEDFYGNTMEAEVVGMDSVTDVALLKVDRLFESVANIVTIRQIQPCQQVYIIGHPSEDLLFSVSSGIVSGINRTIDFSDGTTLKMFQMDAAVNFGNSGGPVYNSRGEVIGMTTAKYQSLTSEGLGFALPIDDAMKIAAELKQYGYVRNRPLLGVTVQNIAENSEGENPAGAKVILADEGLCCGNAGVMKGDIIVELGGKEVTDLSSLTRAKQGFSAGDRTTLKVWREGEFLTFDIIFDEVTPEHPTGTVTLPAEETEESDPENLPENR